MMVAVSSGYMITSPRDIALSVPRAGTPGSRSSAVRETRLVVTLPATRTKRLASSLLMLGGLLIGLIEPANARHGRPAHITCVEVRQFVQVAANGNWDAAQQLALTLPGATPDKVAFARRKCELRR